MNKLKNALLLLYCVAKPSLLLIYYRVNSADRSHCASSKRKISIFETAFKFVLANLLLSSVSFSTHANLGVAISSGQGVHEITPYRFALSWDFGPVWRSHASWALHTVVESSYAIWNSPAREYLGPDRPLALTAMTLGPVIRWQKQNPYAHIKATPYLEMGVGFSWLSETQIQGRMLSLHFQFEDKGGLGVRFGNKQQYDLAIRAYHYSNASIKRPNSGVNLAMLSFGVWFLD